MLFFNRLTAILLTVLLIGPVLPVQAKSKGNQYLAQGRAFEEKKDWDAALDAYEKALSQNPSDVVFQMAAQKARFQASQAHLENGRRKREQGQLGEALLDFQKAYALNPASSAAEQELRLIQQMIERERKRVEQTGKEAPPEVRALTPIEEAKKQTQERLKSIMPLPELRPLGPPITFRVVNQSPRVAFETVARLAAINILWDPDMNPPLNQARNVTVDLTNSTLEEALDYLAMLTKFFWQPLSSNTIFITNDTVNKRRDFEQQVLKVFYLSNINSQQELQEVINAVRTLTEINRIMPFNSQNAIIVRGEADRVAMAEKIISDLDKPRSEVVVDILVLNATNTFSRQITTAVASTGLNVPVTFTPRSGITTTTTTPTGGTPTTTTGNSGVIPLSELGHLSTADYSIALPGALLQAALSDSNTKVLQSPEIRSVDGQKASLKIGDREPTATGSFQPGIGGVGINPLVNTQFTYIDVGVNVDILPRVHDNGDVSLHVELDISNVSGQVNLGGLNQPIISQKKVIHDIRLKEGEVNLLGGLIQQQEDKTVTGIPGLSSIPLIRRLFTGESIDRSRSELMIALIPHVVRRPEITSEDLRGIGVGNATTIKLNFGPRPSEEQAARPAAPTAPPTPSPSPAAPPATAPPVTAPIAPPNRNVPPPPPGPGATVQFQPGQIQTSLNGTFTASLALQGVDSATAGPLQIQFDPRLLKLNDVTAGDLMTQGGQQPVIARNIQNDAGTATIQISRPPNAPPVSGNGVLLNLTFQAVGSGAANVTVSNLGVTNTQGQVTPGGGPPLVVRIQ